MNDGRSCRVLVRGSTVASNARVIVVGLNGSQESWNALDWACAEALYLTGSIAAVQVGPVNGLGTRIGQLVQDSTNDATIQVDLDRLNGLQNHVQERAIRFGVKITFVHVQGDPVTELLRIADYHRSNLIVAGRSTSASPDFISSLARTYSNDRDLPVVVDALMPWNRHRGLGVLAPSP